MEKGPALLDELTQVLLRSAFIGNIGNGFL